MFSKYRGFSKLWPYIAFQGLEPGVNYLWIINAYEPKTINRVLLPHENLQITHSFMTVDRDLFVVCEEEKQYNLYHINLDRYSNSFSKTGQIFTYSQEMSYPKEVIQRGDEREENHDDLEMRQDGYEKKRK